MCIIKQTEEVYTFSKFVSFSAATIMVIIIIFYAGLRYDTTTAFNAEFASVTGDMVQFPAVTLCPMTPGGSPGLSSQYYAYRTYGGVGGYSDTTPAAPPSGVPNVIALTYRGNVMNCLQYNYDININVQASGTLNAMVIRFSQDLSALSDPFAQTGAIGLLHPQGESPVFEDAPMFVAPLGETVQVAILNYYWVNTKSEPIGQEYVAVPSLTSHNGNAATENTSQIILAYDQFGYYVQQQYYVYRVWNWIGEVGGAACLVFLLQHFIVWLAIAIGRRTCFKEDRKRRKMTEAIEQAQAQAPRAAQPSETMTYPPVNPSPSDSAPTRRRPRKAKRSSATDSPSPDSEVEMTQTKPQRTSSPTASASPSNSRRTQPASDNDRIVIDMASMDDPEDS